MAKYNPDAEAFRKEYEERYGEKILAYGLGRYLGGWKEYDGEFWGLVIATEGGFRFHHFPHEGWLQMVSRSTTGGKPPQEKTIFVPRDSIVSAEYRTEKSWWRRILFPSHPLIAVKYRNAAGSGEILCETDSRSIPVADSLKRLIGG
ncbi:hypothetical protein [Breznakiella homolactica]|uniref:Uncharacterized protein n=1 Tax=Breznakiella homolactica TaxID=2798577 RepID=A0A7T7XN70_9SPIR|nr:hypothetical protein [Breznakiella homolactica]QQO09436.1 hypothetical protein JFL75_00495 [Breznakiella homolactica]